MDFDKKEEGSGDAGRDDAWEGEQPLVLPIDGVLDLHAFHPREVKELVPDYLGLCLEKGIRQVRIIHGKGAGVLRRIVHSILEKDQRVTSFRLAGGDGGSWGATLVELHDGACGGSPNDRTSFHS